MASSQATALPATDAPRRPASGDAGKRAGATLLAGAGIGLGATYLSLVMLLPLAAIAVTALEGGFGGFWDAVTGPQAVAALRFTFLASLAVVLVNAVMGTLIAWVMVRDQFFGKRFVNALLDLPFALPTIVAGLTLLALYGPKSPLGVNIAFTRVGVVLALLFVTLPFVVRSVQPVLEALESDVEEAAASLGAGGWTTFRRVVLPHLRPAIMAGCALSFGRALGEFGSVVLIAGNLPFNTEVASVFIFGQIENDDIAAAAAVSLVLLAASFALLASIAAINKRYDLDVR